MNTSLFFELVEKYFKAVIGQITEKYNGNAAEPTMLHKTMLSEEYSPDLHWGATELNHSIVAADVVSLDSSLPLKKRGTISTAAGTVAKIGVKFRKSEKQILAINTMIATGTDEATVASKVFDDAVKVVRSIDVRTEIMFQQGLSTGQLLVTDFSDDNSNNDGVGVRADFGYLAENTFKAIVAPWGKKQAKPIDDIRQMFDKANADSNVISHVYLDLKYFNLLRNSVQGKLLTATFNNQVITSTSLLPVPSRRAFLDALQDEFGAEFHIVDSTFKTENADGTTTAVKPWAEAHIIGVPQNVVGRLVYSTLAEETNPVQGVNYQKSGSHILVSKYSKTDPLEEFTAGQSLCLPVIDGGSSIYMLVANEAGDNAITIEGDDVVDGGISAPKAASTKSFNVVYAGDIADITVSTEASWLTLTNVDGAVTVNVAANSGSQRTGDIIVTDGYNTETVTVTQSA